MPQLAQDMEVMRVVVVANAFLPEAKVEDDPLSVWWRMAAHHAPGVEELAGSRREDLVPRVIEEQLPVAVLEPGHTLEI
jgi:hypothetical protein